MAMSRRLPSLCPRPSVQQLHLNRNTHYVLRAYRTNTANQLSSLRPWLRRTVLFLDRNFSHEQPRTNKPKPGQRNSKVPPLRAKTPLEGFFSKYPKFKFQPSNSPTVEFDHLCKLYKLEKGCWEWKAARKLFNIALKEELDIPHGTNEHNLKKWQWLCHILRLNPVPDTIRKFRDAVVNIHVNLVDLVHQVVHGPKEELIFFKTEKQLSDYTIKTGKYFPKEGAKDSEVLQALRRHILLPREGRGFSRRKKSNKGTKV